MTHCPHQDSRGIHSSSLRPAQPCPAYPARSSPQRHGQPHEVTCPRQHQVLEVGLNHQPSGGGGGGEESLATWMAMHPCPFGPHLGVQMSSLDVGGCGWTRVTTTPPPPPINPFSASPSSILRLRSMENMCYNEIKWSLITPRCAYTVSYRRVGGGLGPRASSPPPPPNVQLTNFYFQVERKINWGTNPSPS